MLLEMRERVLEEEGKVEADVEEEGKRLCRSRGLRRRCNNT